MTAEAAQGLLPPFRKTINKPRFVARRAVFLAFCGKSRKTDNRMQFAIRAARFSDITALFRLSRSFPLTSLPAYRPRIQEIVEASQLSFEKKLPINRRRYVFVLTAGRQLAACSQILARQGQHCPYFTFTEEREGGGAARRASALQPTALRATALQPSAGGQGKTGLGGLVAARPFRRSPEQLGRQIGLFRLLFIKARASEFTQILEVSLTAPQASGEAFYKEAARSPMPRRRDAAFKLCSENPAAFESLCRRAKLQAIPLKGQPKALLAAAFGAVHKETLPAYKGLVKLGFQKTSRRHILDGGIFLEAAREALPFYRQIQEAVFRKAPPPRPARKAYLWARKLAGAGFEGGKAEGALTKEGAFLSSALPAKIEGERLFIAPFSY